MPRNGSTGSASREKLPAARMNVLRLSLLLIDANLEIAPVGAEAQVSH